MSGVRAVRARAGLAGSALALAVGGCAAHLVYDRAGAAAAQASDWTQRQERALAATGRPDARPGGAHVSGSRLTGEVTLPEQTRGGMYDPADYARIKRRDALIQECMTARGYRLLGVPAREMF